MNLANLIEYHQPLWIGYVAVLIAIVFFGSNLVPAGQYPIGDGMSFQFFMCCGAWIVGLFINIFVDSPPFYPLVLLGGIIWTTGNILSVKVISINGLGLSMLLWCTTNLLVGWASGYFGWFGLIPQQVEHPSLNYAGVVLAVFSGLIFLFIRTSSEPVGSGNTVNDERQPILSSAIIITSNDDVPIETSSPTPASSLSKRTIGCLLAIFAGALFGLVFVPNTYIQDHPSGIYQNATRNGLDYVFSMYSGIFSSSILYFIVYLAYEKNRPYINVQSILPGLVSGMMWGIAQAAFLVSNSILNQTISFPLISIGPSTVAVLWSIFYFKDIQGRRNYLIIIVGTLVRIAAAILIILSKPVPH